MRRPSPSDSTRSAPGAFTVLGEPLPVQGAPNLTKYLTQDIEATFGGKFAFESDPVKAARLMIDHIDAKRAALHLPGPMYDVPYAPRHHAADGGRSERFRERSL